MAERALDYGARERRWSGWILFAREPPLRSFNGAASSHRRRLLSADIATPWSAPFGSSSTDGLPLALPNEPPVAAGAHRRQSRYPPRTLPRWRRPTIATRHSSCKQAGNGQDRTLVQRIESLLTEGVDPMSILFSPFSNKAANELSERVCRRIRKLPQPCGSAPFTHSA